jgi:hypothetical protein
MPRVIQVEDEAAASLDDVADALLQQGFDPGDEDSLQHAALQLRRLGNDRSFLGDLLIGELAAHHREDSGENSYGPQVIMLRPPGDGDFFIRANIWPSQEEHAMRASGGGSFVYALPHDHNFSFLTLGYFGPGYWSNYYEFDYEDVTGWRGEPVALRFIEKSRLEEGKIQLYRAHLDVHEQLVPDALSVSLNIMHSSPAQAWFDQYSFDLQGGRVGRIVSNGSNEAFLRIAVGLGSEEAKDLAARFATGHPSDSMRLAAWSALASIESDPAQRDRVWRTAEGAGSRLVSQEARLQREALTLALERAL